MRGLAPWTARNALDFLTHKPFDECGQIIVEPFVEHRAQHVFGDLVERTARTAVHSQGQIAKGARDLFADGGGNECGHILFADDGQRLALCGRFPEMTRFGVMKHLRLLEEANLIVVRRSGREKLHYLNPIPIRQIHNRWIDKYTEARASALLDLKTELEKEQ